MLIWLEWVEWPHGRMSGEARMPPWEFGVTDAEIISVQLRDGREVENQANRFSWHHSGGDDDVMRFRQIDIEAFRIASAPAAESVRAL